MTTFSKDDFLQCCDSYLVGGKLVNLYATCRREAYLYHNGVLPYAEHVKLEIGTLEHKRRGKNEVRVGHAVFDRLVDGVLIEQKHSKAGVAASKAQLSFYMTLAYSVDMHVTEGRLVLPTGHVFYSQPWSIEVAEGSWRLLRRLVEDLTRPIPDFAPFALCRKCAFQNICHA